MRIPGIYMLLLLAAAVVLAFVLEFVAFYRDAMRTPVFAGIGAEPDSQSDRHVSRRLPLIVAAVAFVFVAGLIAAYFVDPDWGISPAGRRIAHPYSLLLYGALICAIAWLSGIKPTQPVLLFCLTLPQLIITPLVGVVGGSMYNPFPVAIWTTLFVFFMQPSGWILLFIGLGQARLLNRSDGAFTMGGLVRLFLILFAYIFGSIY